MKRPASQKAFTLIEVLVAVLILGIVSAMVLLNLNRSDLRTMETNAQLLESWVDDLRDRAILYGSVVGVYIEAGQPRAAQWYDQRWWPGMSAQTPQLSDALQYEFYRPDEEGGAQPQQVGETDEPPPIEPGMVVMPDGSLLADVSLVVRSPQGAALRINWTQSGASPTAELQ